MKLLIRLDDLGFSEGVNFGIEHVVRTLPNLCVGMMTNMDSIQHGYDLIKDHCVCLGIHMNITAGKPLCSKEDILSLVNAQGEFYPSATFRNSNQDIVDIQDAEKECEAQYQAFLSITGKKPTYIDVHAIQSTHFLLAAKSIAKKHHVLFVDVGDEKNQTLIRDQQVGIKVAQNSMTSKTKDIEELYQNTCCETNILVFHPGYADAYIMKHSSIHLHRAYDVETLLSTEFQKYLNKKNLTLITFNQC